MSHGRVVSCYVKAEMADVLDHAVEEGDYRSISAVITTALEMWRRAGTATAVVPDFEAVANINPEYAAAVEEELAFGFIPDARAGKNSRLVSARISDQDARALDVIRETPGITAETTSDLLRGFVRVCTRAIARLGLEEFNHPAWHNWLLVGKIEQTVRREEAKLEAVRLAAKLLDGKLAAYSTSGNMGAALGLYSTYCEEIAQLGPEAETLGKELLDAIPVARTIRALLDQRIELSPADEHQ